MRYSPAFFAAFTLSLASLFPATAQTETYSEWLQTARIGGLALEPGASLSEVDVRILAYRDQGVSVIELDSGLSHYLNPTEFAAQVAHIDLVAQRAHAEGLKVVIYYPSLEVLTPNGANLANTMGKDHPDWLQIGLNGTPNVFYGTQEHWVPPNAESAWLSPNSAGYKNYFVGRVQQLAGTAVDGIWIDVPLYLDTGVQWSDVHPEAVAAFEAWSAQKGYNYTGPPAAADMTDQKFRHWLKWRNDNLAEFIDEVRASALATNPAWAFVTEVYPIDYLDSIWVGLEPAVMKRASNSIVVWELDGVSDGLGMEYANVEDFSNLIAMTKMTRAFDRGRPGWGFSYGNQPIDAGLVMASAIANQVAPFETKTPIMTNSVGSDFRTKWFEFVRDNEEALLETARIADVGVWFSPDSKTFHDFAQGGIYGMYLDLEPPPGADSWWAVLPELSLRQTSHLAGWRGAAYALNQMHVPYKAVVDPGDPVGEMQGLSMMWLPSVAVLSDASAQMLRDFVNAGGTVFATGVVPGLLDEDGVPRAQSNLADVFGFSVGPVQGARMQSFGTGTAIYRPDLKGVDLFETGGALGAAALKEVSLGQVEQIVRIHTPDRIIADEVGDDVFIDLSVATPTAQHAFVLNYSGLQKPAIKRPARVPFHYAAPDGFRVTGATINQPGNASLSGPLAVARSGEDTWVVEPLVEQFAIVTFQLAPDPGSPLPVPPALQFATQERQDAVNDALDFVINDLRHTVAAPPYAYGIHTNLIDNNLDTTVYTGGHHVTDEHMGLFLRVVALLQNQGRYDEAMQFVEEVFYSSGYHVLAWSMHKDKLKPFLQPDLLNGQDVWMAANAPLDDLRAVRGMFDGAAAFGQPDVEQLAHNVLDGIYWTSVTDRIRGLPASHPQYPGGVIGFSWDWEDQDDGTLTPAAVATGLGRLGADLIPVDYQDLGTLAIGARKNPRLRGVLASAVDMMLAAEIPGSPGLFYNGLAENNVWTGDFEFQGERPGNNLKVIQELWTALHLARVAKSEAYVLDATRRQAAADAALRSYTFFKNFYNANGQRVPEYLTFSGTDVPDGNTGNNLIRGTENLFGGEARIYSQLARLALLMDDAPFAASVIETKILTDRITDPGDPRFGLIGATTAGASDAEAFNVLEALLTLCLEAQPAVTPPGNTAPVANNDTLQAGKDNPTLFPRVDLLGNDTDADDDVLVVTGVDPVTSQGGTLLAQGERWLYTPPSGFVGSDTFNYTMTDGVANAAAVATIEVREGGGIALEISLDGDLVDWPAGHFVVNDPSDISGSANKLDLLELHMTVQDGKLYVAYVNELPVVYNWAYMLYVDTDSSAATGYQVGEIGAEFVLEENSFQAYTGTGEDWAWQVTAAVSPFVKGNVVEFAIPLSAIGASDSVRFFFIGDNLAYEPNGIGEDHVPEASANGQWITYDLVQNQGAIGSAPLPGTEGVDGDLSDWDASHFVLLDPNDVSGAANKLDLRELHVWADTANARLNLGYVNEQAVDYNFAYILFIDTDSNPATGYQFFDVGAEFIIQDNQLQSYAGTGLDWLWAIVAPVVGVVQGNTVELSASLVAMGNPSNMRLQFYGDNTAYPGGLAEDFVPDVNAGLPAAYVQFSAATNIGTVGSAPDTDLIPDTWEVANGLDPFSNDSLLDPENDGVPHIAEWALDQDPLQPDIEPLLLSLVETGSTVQAMIDYRAAENAAPAVTIVIEKSSDPSSGSWAALPAGQGDSPVAGVVSWRVTDPETFDSGSGTGPLAMFYRLRLSGSEAGVPFEYISPMVGYRRLRCPDGSDTYTGLPFRARAVHRADLTIAPAPSVTPGQWSLSDATLPVEVLAGQLIRFESGALAGRSFRIAALSSGGLEIEGDLTGAQSGDRYRIAPVWSLSTLFGTAGSVMEDSPDFLGFNRGHEVLSFAPRGTGQQRSAAAVYYHLLTGWRSTASATAPEDNLPLDPDAALVVRASGAVVTGEAWLVLAGAVVETPIATTISPGASDTIVGLQRPFALKLRESGLLDGGAFVGSANSQPGVRADELLVFDNLALGFNKAPLATYFYDLSAGLWRSTADPGSDAGDTELEAGAFLILRSAGGPERTWTLPVLP